MDKNKDALDKNLFTEKELVSEFEHVEHLWLRVEKDKDKILTNEKNMAYPIRYNFDKHRIYSDKSDSLTLSDDILTLIAFIYFFYFKIEINNKIQAGICSFEDGFKTYREYQKEHNYYGKLTLVAREIENKRNDLFNMRAKIIDDQKDTEEKSNDLEIFWRRSVHECFFEYFPLFKHFVDNLRHIQPELAKIDKNLVI